MSLAREAEGARSDIAEGFCPVCRVPLRPHDGRGCCRCCGGAYEVTPNLLVMGSCDLHMRRCRHWELTYLRADGLARPS